MDRGVIRRLISIAVVVLPLGLGVVYGLVNLFAGWSWLFPGHDRAFYGLPPMGLDAPYGSVFLLCWASIAFFAGMALSKLESRQLKLCATIFCVAVALRLALPILFHDGMRPWSDFAQAWSRALGNPLVRDYHKYNPAWMNYALFLRGLAAIFGRHFTVDLLQGIVFDGATAVGLFLAAREFTGNARTALTASIMYAFNPSSVVYAMTASPEHGCIALFTFAWWTLFRGMRADGVGHFLGWAVLTGLLAGFGNALKPFFPVFGTAAMFVFALDLMERRDLPGRARAARFAMFLLVYAVELAVCRSVTFATEREFNEDLHSHQIASHYLCVGLHPDGEGQLGVSPKTRRWVELVDAGTPRSEAGRIVAEELKDAWRNRLDEMPSFLLRKTIWTWQDDNRGFRYFSEKMGLQKLKRPRWRAEVFRQIRKNGPTLGQCWYLAMMSAALICAVKFCSRARKTPLGIVFAELLLLGFAGLMLLGEAQSRYKCLVLPAACVLAASAWRYDDLKE